MHRQHDSHNCGVFALKVTLCSIALKTKVNYCVSSLTEMILKFLFMSLYVSQFLHEHLLGQVLPIPTSEDERFHLANCLYAESGTLDSDVFS